MMKELDERKALGPDGVSGYSLKECRQEMAEPIYYISVFSKQEKVPIESVRTYMILIYKNGSKEEPPNYRPVSCKIYEKVIKKQ